ncbi:MAG: preprotein translocase subunit SecE [Chloroflexi bacterium]|nr:preprotein translocase subunit SecE [Chloroflexota bacterium]MDL1885352.1 preprotein translocase subunit SecE [Anaerolineae bacterium CFX8]
MSAEHKTLDNNSKRRRGKFRREAPEAPVQNIEVTDDLEDDDDEEGLTRGLTERKGRATPGRRAQEVEVSKSEGNFITRPIRGLREYLEGVRSEIQKVVWPSREETRRLTGIVLSVTIVSALVLGIISLLFNELFALGLRNPLVFGIVFVLILGAFLYYLRRNSRQTSSF